MTRAEDQASELSDALRRAGAEVEALPLLEIVAPADERPLERAATELALFQWLVLTSTNAVDAILQRCGGALPPSLEVATVGERTARALEEWGIEADLIPSQSTAEGLASALVSRLGRQERILLPQAADARPVLRERLSAAGAEVVAVVAYEKRVPANAAEAARRLFGHGTMGWVTFTSPSTARNLAAILGNRWQTQRAGLLALSIGPVTTRALRELGVEAITEATSPSSEGLVSAWVRAVDSAPQT